jgi:4-hydroxy-tetrahydrodipicolinate reductase
MKIALIGYGKMGRAIEKAALVRGHEIVLKISSSNTADMTTEKLKLADVAIEFTSPDAARNNVLECLDAGINVVSGTTGWGEGLAEAGERAKSKDVAFLHATNFSIGVNIFFEVNKLLAALMNDRAEYNVEIDETHHIHKKDMPGGTAITIAEQILGQLKSKTGWILNEKSSGGNIPVFAHRVDEVPGTHRVTYSSEIDTIDIIHTAHNRDGFGIGAVMAAEFLAGKKGVFTMKDVLG